VCIRKIHTFDRLKKLSFVAEHVRVQQLLILITGIKTILFYYGYLGERNLRLEGRD
jgi:hypothetical protein